MNEPVAWRWILPSFARYPLIGGKPFRKCAFMEEKGWKILTLILVLPSSIIGYVASFYFIMELLNNPTDLRYIIVAIVLAIYTLFILFVSWLWLIKIPSKKAHKKQKPKKEFKNKNLPTLQKGIKEQIIPQLENKIIDPFELSEYNDITDYLEIWNKGRMQKFSTSYRLTKIEDFQLIFTNQGKILKDFKNADKELSNKLDKLLKELKKYDRKMGEIIHKIFIYYEKNISHENWRNLGELEYYGLFDIDEDLRRIGHDANPNNLSTSEIVENELIKDIQSKANELISKCEEIMNWGKKSKKKK